MGKGLALLCRKPLAEAELLTSLLDRSCWLARGGRDRLAHTFSSHPYSSLGASSTTMDEQQGPACPDNRKNLGHK